MSTKFKSLAFKESTARFSNRLPHWHPMRGLPATNWRSVFGPVIADHTKEASDMVSQFRADIFLGTATLDAPAKLYSAPVSDADFLPAPKNLIKNSDFSADTKDGYHGWKNTGTGQYTQYMVEMIPKGANLVLRFDGTGIAQVTVNAINTTTGAAVVLTATTTGVPVTYSLSGLEVDNVVVDGSYIDATISLFIGSGLDKWTRHPADSTYWLERAEPASFFIKGDTRKILQAENLTDMFHRTPPTKLGDSLIELPIDTDLFSRVNFLDFKVEYHNNEYPKEYSVFDGKIRKTIDRSVIYDYTIQELNYDGIFRNVEYEIVTIHIVNDMIVALAKMAVATSSSSASSSSSSQSLSEYFLLYLSPDHVIPEDSIMQVIKSFSLGFISEFTGKDVVLSARANDPGSVVFIVSDLVDSLLYELPVFYDYFYFDTPNQELVFRENYSAVTGLSVTQLQYSPNFNHLDEHGLMRSLPRLKEESNYDYKNRLVDYSSIHLPGINQAGLQNGMNIRFGLEIIDAIFTIEGNINLLKSKNNIFIYTPNNVISESGLTDSNYYEYQLDYIPAEVRSIKVNGILYPASLYTVDGVSDIIRFADYPVIEPDSTVEVSYIPYDNIIDISGMSVRQVYLALDSLGYTVITETDLNTMATLAGEHLLDIAGSNSIPFTFYPAVYNNFDLSEFAEFQDLSVSFPGFTVLQQKVIDIRNSVHDEWNRQIEGKDRWDMVANNAFGGGLLPGYHDGFFSWLKDSNGNLLHHIDGTGGPYVKQGFTLDQIQSGVNASLRDLEIESDLEVKSISLDYYPQVQPGFFYIKEMQFYMFADKQVELLSDIAYTKIDLDTIRADYPHVDLTGVDNCTYKFDGLDLYVLSTDMGAGEILVYDNITGLPDTIALTGYDIGSDYYFLSEEPYVARPVVITDMDSSPQELQFDLKPSGLLIPLMLVNDPSNVKVEYDSKAGPELAELPVDIKRARGFLSIVLDAPISEASISLAKPALVNGKGKAKLRRVYDPDVVIPKDMDRDPGIFVVLDKNLDLTLPPPFSSTVPNPNLYTQKQGWGHNWGFDFSN